MYYNLINDKETISVCKEWREKYQLDRENEDIWNMSHKCCSEVKILQLQWKILHRIYPTGTLLLKMKLKESEECEFCNERDTITHFFASCPVSKKVWHEAETKISSHLGKIFKLSETIIIFGLLYDEHLEKKDINFINKMCLIGKLTISKYKFRKTGIIEMFFENELRIRGLIE